MLSLFGIDRHEVMPGLRDDVHRRCPSDIQPGCRSSPPGESQRQIQFERALAIPVRCLKSVRHCSNF